MRFLIEYNDTYAQAQLQAGAHALWLGDCVATSHFISWQHYRDLAAEYADESARRIRQAGGMVFYHGCERSIPHLEIMADLAFDTINIGEGVDIGDVKRAIGSRMCIMGNLDTLNVLREKSPLQVEQETKEIVEKGKVGGGYIFCTGEDIPGDTPRQNVTAMVNAVRRYGGPSLGCGGGS
jgi:uroporphyrinogen decarboxylase